MKLIDGHKVKKAVHEHPTMRMHKSTALRLVDSVPEIDPVHAAGGCYCHECEYYKPGKHFADINFCHRLPLYADKGGLNTADDDFCSRGRRREADQ